MAFFKLFRKKKKDDHKKLSAGTPSPPSTPPSPAAPVVPPAAAIAAPPRTPEVQRNDAQTFMESIREESLYTTKMVDSERGKTTTTERIASPTNGVSTPQSIRDYEANQAAIDLTRSLVKRFIADIWNRGEVDLIPDVCSPSLRFNGNTGFDRVGHEGLARMVNTIREALDDYHCEIHSMVVEHNKAFCRLRFTGKMPLWYLALGKYANRLLI